MSLSTKQYGNIGVAHCISYMVKKGYTVSIPLSDAQDYDLVVDIEGILKKVQVKTTQQTTPYNLPMVTVKSSGGTSGKMYGSVLESGCDLLYVYHTGVDSAWLIPVTDDLPRTSINLGDKYSQYKLMEA